MKTFPGPRFSRAGAGIAGVAFDLSHDSPLKVMRLLPFGMAPET